MWNRTNLIRPYIFLSEHYWSIYILFVCSWLSFICMWCKIFCIFINKAVGKTAQTKYCDSLYAAFFIFLQSIVFIYWPFVDGITMNISCQMNSADKDSICRLHYDCDVFSPPLITHFITRKALNNIVIWKLVYRIELFISYR